MIYSFSDPAFWVLVSFSVFFILAWKPVWKAVTTALDARSAQIREELDKAVRLREEAQAILARYQKQERESLLEAERIVEQTKADAKAMAEKAEADLKSSLEKRKQIAMNKIAQAETKAMQAVQQHVVDIAASAARTVIQEELAKGQAAELLKLATNDIERKVH